MQMHRSKQGGWSLIELTIILIVLSILSAILIPVVDRYVRNAKVIRAREDVSALGSAVWMFIEDTANSYFLKDGSPDPKKGASRKLGGGSAPDQWDYNAVDVLVGDGDIPEVGENGNHKWTRPVDLSSIDFFEYHLVTNRPGNTYSHAYRTPTDLGKGPEKAAALTASSPGEARTSPHRSIPIRGAIAMHPTLSFLTRRPSRKTKMRPSVLTTATAMKKMLSCFRPGMTRKLTQTLVLTV
jgi:type II secretory pathway pseudopilin PulG